MRYVRCLSLALLVALGTVAGAQPSNARDIPGPVKRTIAAVARFARVVVAPLHRITVPVGDEEPPPPPPVP